MREIKFRIWLGNKYKQYPQEHADKKRCSHSPCMYGNVGDFGVFGFDQREDYVLEQFTGIKDKNGIEIYEGDIISCFEHMGNGMRHLLRPVAVVMWDGCCWCYSLDTTRNFVNPHQILRYAIRPEVIGNIHENPELLK